MRLACSLLSVVLVAAAAFAGDAVGPRRIASGSLASDEILLELLGRRGERDRLIAVSTLATDPRYSNVVDLIPKTLTGRAGGELESLLALKPDLVILASYNKPETLARLADAKVNILKLTEFRSLDDIEYNMTRLGEAVKIESDAAKLVGEFRAARAAFESKAKAWKLRPKVLGYSEDRVLSGKNTLFDAMVTAVGGVNVAAEAGLTDWPQVGVEALLTLRPDVLVVTGDPKKADEYLREVRAAPGWQEMAAVKAGRIVVIPGAEIAAVSQHVLKALQKLQAGIEPK